MPAGNAHVEVQERDIALLRELFVSRIMTLAHAGALHFEGRSEAAKKRVQKLKAAGFLAERPRKSRDPGILTLTRNGFRELVENGHIADLPRLSAAAFERRARVSDLTIRHELAVMDVKTALVRGISAVPGMKMVEFTTWPLLHQFDVLRGRAGKVRMKPDGFLRVEETSPKGEVFEHTFFLEVDRGSESLDTLTTKALCYREHYASGGYVRSRGGKASEYAEYPFRVLFVMPSEERLRNTAHRLLTTEPPVETQVWLATAADMSNNPLGAVWVRPKDFREVIRGNRHMKTHAERRALFSD